MKHHSLHPVVVHLEAKHHKLLHGKPVQLSHAHLAGHIGCGVEIHLKKSKVTKIHRAHRLGKGHRLSLDADEMHANGEGIADFFKKAYNIGKEVWNHVKPVVGPILSEVIDYGGPLAVEALAGLNPEYSESIRKIGHKALPAVQKALHEQLGYGLKKCGHKRGHKCGCKVVRAKKHGSGEKQYGKIPTTLFGHTGHPAKRGHGLAEEYRTGIGSTLIGVNHPAQHPKMLIPIGEYGGNMLYLHKHAGSFLQAGSHP